MKKLLFGIASLVLFTSLTIQAHNMRWQQLRCTDGTDGVYEICWYTGDGNECDTYREKTRNCDPITDPGDPIIN